MLGVRLALERRRLKLSQREVAELMGVSRSAVAMYETDRCPIDADRLAQLGDHGFDLLQIMVDEPGHVAAGRMLNWQLNVAIGKEVDDWALRRGIDLPQENKALIVQHLYLKFAASGEFDQASLSEALRKAA